MNDDPLLRQHIVELHRKVDLTLKVLVRQQELLLQKGRRKTKTSSLAYLRRVIWKQRETLAKQRHYIKQLEQELRLRGLE